MNKNVSFYFRWLLIIVVSLLLGLILVFNFTSSTEEIKSSLNNSNTVIEDERTTKVNEIFNSLSLEQKIGQLFLARVPEINQIEDIQNYYLGGYLIFGRDTENENFDSLTQKIQSWQEAASIPMIIASDEEGGYVTRVSTLLEEKFLSPGELYNIGGVELISEDAIRKAQILKELGINVNLGPVADIAVNPSSFIYDRTLMLPIETALEEAAAITAEYVEVVVRNSTNEGIGSTLKHFPGYGENGDTHTDIIVDEKTIDVFEKIDFIPFKAGINAGAGAVLISHNIVNSIDPTQPASISPSVHTLLRKNLGFNGVIMTDDLDMMGLSDFIDKDSAAIATINAGTDLIISSTYASQIEQIKLALDNKIISNERFDEAVKRVLAWKYDLGLFSN